jgi:epoxyqueuosine reductase
MATELRASGWRAQVYADDNALVDREAAWRAGIGWFGKNANLLLPKAGSWFVLGAVLTNAPLPATDEPMADGCGSCQRCLPACPTGAIVSPGVIDARRCLAWVAQRAGSIPIEYRIAMHDRLYGCDDCQTSCPPNVVTDRHAVPVSIGRRAACDEDQQRVPPSDCPRSLASTGGAVALRAVLEASDEALLKQFGHWYIAGRDPRWIRRNALVAIGNVGSLDDRDDVRLVMAAIDGIDELLGEHARWALDRLVARSTSAATAMATSAETLAATGQ